MSQVREIIPEIVKLPFSADFGSPSAPFSVAGELQSVRGWGYSGLGAKMFENHQKTQLIVEGL